MGDSEESTQFKPNNRFWEQRSSHGRSPIFKDPDQLWEACVQYFEYINDNPEMIAETVKFQGFASVVGVPHRRNMSEDGLIDFLDICQKTWWNYKQNPDFLLVTEKVCRIIRTQKMDGAITGQFNANIIARELGLVDKQKHEHSGAVLTPATKEMTYDEARQLYQENMRADEGRE